MDSKHSRAAGETITKDDGLIFSRKVGGEPASFLWNNNYTAYQAAVLDIESRPDYAVRVQPGGDLFAEKGHRPTWLDRYDQYDANEYLGMK